MYVLKGLHGPKGECLVFCLSIHLILPFGFKCFFFYVAHQVGPPLTLSFQVDSVHLWLVFSFNKDPPWTLFVILMVRIELNPMMLFKMLSLSSWKSWSFMFHKSKLTCFHCLFLSLFASKLTSCYLLMAFALCLMLSLLMPPK